MKYPLLDPLRGCAALWVFFFHFQFSSWIEGSILQEFARVGHLGVPMFFVISGYCITASARSSLRWGEPWRRFLYRRAVRIYPPFWFSILAVASIPFAIEGISSLKTGRFTLPTAESSDLRYFDFSPAKWMRMATLTQVYYPDAEAQNLAAKFSALNSVYWTLAIEVQFYLVAAFAVACRSWFYRVLALMTFISVPFVLYAPSQVWGVFLPFWPQFAAGCLLFWALESGKSPGRVFGSYAKAAGLLVTAAAVTAFAVCVASGVGVESLPFAVGFAIVLWANKKADGPRTALCDKSSKSSRSSWRVDRAVARLLGVLGLMSYSLYLLHTRVQYLSLHMTRQVFPPGLWQDFATIGLACGFCYLFYRMCEAPFVVASQAKRVRSEDPQPQAPPANRPVEAALATTIA